MRSCRLRQIQAGWGGSPSHGGHTKNNTRAICCVSAPPHQVSGVWSWGALFHLYLQCLCPPRVLFTGIPGCWAGFRGQGQPTPGQRPLCPGVVDLLRRVQKAPERNQLELEPGSQLPAPRPLPACPGCSCSKALVSSCPRLGAEHALGICHEAVGNFASLQEGRAGRGASPSLSPSLLLTLRKP